MKAKTLLCSAVLALAASAALAQDIDRRMLQHADILVMPVGRNETPSPLQRIVEACGSHSQPQVPFSKAELDWLVQFGSRSAENTARVCKAFQGRLST